MQSISLSKLAGLMEMDEPSLRAQLMLLKQVRAPAAPSPDSASAPASTSAARCQLSAQCRRQCETIGIYWA